MAFGLSLYFNTLRFLRRKQLLYYIRFQIFYGVYRTVGSIIEGYFRSFIPSSIGVKNIRFFLLKRLLLLENSGSEKICKLAGDIRKRRFVFLNVERKYGNKVIWNDKNMSKLWRYNLHYFTYVIYLAKAYLYTKDLKYYLDFKAIIHEWIETNSLGQGDGWEPYPVSSRIVNWIKAYILFEELIKEDSEFQRLFLKELYLETLFLERNLEFHLYGNHLLKNIKALIFSGVFFESKGADKWIGKGLRMLQEELKEQIVLDGGHFERSPMYHKIVLQDLLEIYALLKDHGSDQDLSWLEKKIHSMFFFLEKILHPDGEIPLFNDSTLDEAPTTEVLFRIYTTFFQNAQSIEGGKLTIKELKESGYFVIQDDSGSNKAIIDCGRIGPDYQPGHAHCDTLSYELSLKGKRFIVDTGVYEYAIGEKRHYSRSTKAHNTVVVDGLDQSQIWSSFRVAKRAYPIHGNVGEVEGFGYFEGSHNGYQNIDVTHRRKAWFRGAKVWLILDEIEGKGEHKLESFIHFHPAIRLSLKGKEVYIEFESAKFKLVPIGEADVDLIKTPYFPEFGKEEERFSVRVSKDKAHLPHRFGYAVIPNFKGKVYLQGKKIICEIDNDKKIILT